MKFIDLARTYPCLAKKKSVHCDSSITTIQNFKFFSFEWFLFLYIHRYPERDVNLLLLGASLFVDVCNLDCDWSTNKQTMRPALDNRVYILATVGGGATPPLCHIYFCFFCLKKACFTANLPIIMQTHSEFSEKPSSSPAKSRVHL